MKVLLNGFVANSVSPGILQFDDPLINTLKRNSLEWPETSLGRRLASDINTLVSPSPFPHSASVQVRRPARQLRFVSEGRSAVWLRVVQRREPLHPQAALSSAREPVAGAQRHQQQVHPPADHQGGAGHVPHVTHQCTCTTSQEFGHVHVFFFNLFYPADRHQRHQR